MKMFNYDPPWYNQKVQKLKDATVHQIKAAILYSWISAALIYVTTLWLYKLIIDTAEEIQKRKKEGKK